MTILDDLRWRGLIHQCSNEAALAERLAAGPVTLYCGFDPTATSLHVGNLVPLLALVRFQRAGHRVLALVGGATGLIGDPSGKSAERVLQTPEEVLLRAGRIEDQLARFVGTQGADRGAVVNNLDWTQDLNVLEFLRDVGKHFSVNAMMHRDSVRSRLAREGEGISFTEFSYMLLQAFDFLKLAEREGCALQIGGSDQWGNLCSGLDLIRRKQGAEAFALTFPLLTTHDGKKFGKSEKGAVWLDPALTSVWEFFQFWLNADDKDVVQLLKLFTFLSREDIEGLEHDTLTQPHLRRAQRRLAREMTALVHGTTAAEEAIQMAEVLFGKGDPASLSETALEALCQALPHLDLEESAPLGLALAMVKLGLEASTTRANETVRAGGASVNGVRLNDPLAPLASLNWLHDRFLLVKKGKKHFGVIQRTPQERGPRA